MKVLRSFPIMVELSVLKEYDGELSTVYVVRSSNGQPVAFCREHDDLTAYICSLLEDVVDEVKQNDSNK